MDTSKSNNSTHWYAIRTHANQESRAYANLTAWKLETFFPRVKEQRRNQFSGASVSLTKPLFPRYLFARFDLERLLHKVCFVRGVQNVVSFGGIPSPVDDEIIEFFQTRTNEDGFVRMGDELKPGDRVMMKGGLFDSLVGVLEKEMNDSERVIVLLQAINYQGHVIVERNSIQKVLAGGA